MRKNSIIRLVPRIGLPPRPYKLMMWENLIVQSLDNCPLEHSHFIAEHCRMNPLTVELFLRYAKYYSNRTLEHCAKDLYLKHCGYWTEPTDKFNHNLQEWYKHLPPIAQELRQQILDDYEKLKASYEIDK